eukprot:s650_g6.t1
MSGLGQASGDLVPFRLDLETIEVPLNWGWAYFDLMLVFFFLVVMAGFYYMTKIIRDLHGQVLQLRAELSQQSNESAMDHDYITAVHVGLIRMGGFVQPNVPVTRQDWDNWHYVERNNKSDENAHCRRRLQELQRFVHRRRRYSTPPRRAHADDENEEAEEEHSPNQGEDPEWPSGFRGERRQTLPEAFEEEPTEPNENPEEDDEDEDFHEEGEEEAESEGEQSFRAAPMTPSTQSS